VTQALSHTMYRLANKVSMRYCIDTGYEARKLNYRHSLAYLDAPVLVPSPSLPSNARLLIASTA
jgi:hypothetical protein